MFRKYKERKEQSLAKTFANMVKEYHQGRDARREEARAESERKEQRLIEDGLLDPGQPTLQAHTRHVERMEAEFNPRERRLIRHSLGL